MGKAASLRLLALVPDRFRLDATHHGRVTGIALMGVIGAALLYGDGVITPAISVLSAVEGLTIASARFQPWIVPLTSIILIALFAVQRRGTGSVGRLFGPVMAVWFATLAGLGVWHIVEQFPAILQALSPVLWGGLLCAAWDAWPLDLRLSCAGGDRRWKPSMPIWVTSGARPSAEGLAVVCAAGTVARIHGPGRAGARRTRRRSTIRSSIRFPPGGLLFCWFFFRAPRQ